MQVILERLLEVILAMFIAGAVLFVYNGITAGNWVPDMIIIVPLSLMFAMFFAAMAAADLSKGLFLVLLAMLVLSVYLIARFARPRAMRIGAEALAFIGYAFVQIILFAAQGITS